jgi:hypothetical protein
VHVHHSKQVARIFQPTFDALVSIQLTFDALVSIEPSNWLICTPMLLPSHSTLSKKEARNKSFSQEGGTDQTIQSIRRRHGKNHSVKKEAQNKPFSKKGCTEQTIQSRRKQRIEHAEEA